MAIARLADIDLHYMQFPAAARPGVASADMVMIHGLAASSAFWYGAGAPRLSQFGRVTLYDLRGHGRSEAPPDGYSTATMSRDLEELLDELGIVRAHLIAHSFGGLVALRFALRNPERVASLVLEDVRGGSVSARAGWPLRTARMMAATRGGAADPERSIKSLADGVAYLEKLARQRLHDRDHGDSPAHQGRAGAGPSRFFGLRSARRWLDLLEHTTLRADTRNEQPLTRPELRTIARPALVLVGKKSSTLSSCRTVARQIPGAVLKEIPDAGHFFPITRPARFLRPTARFLRRAVIAGGADEPGPRNRFAIAGVPLPVVHRA